MNNTITIVTAFFDIGRGSWGAKGFSRSIDEYFKHFSRLAQLDNNMVIFTSKEFEADIARMRKGKKTQIIVIDIFQKFKNILTRIREIQGNPEYRSLISLENIDNPECWSPDYVLVNNLKYFFVNQAIKEGMKSDLIAWVDFGYCRNIKTLYGMQNWSHSFSLDKIHLFTIVSDFEFGDTQKMQERALSNNPVTIGGVMIASESMWKKFYRITVGIQNRYLKKNIIDDDQGTTLISIAENQKIFDLHYLGHHRWFHVFRLFNDQSAYYRMDKLKIKLGLKK